MYFDPDLLLQKLQAIVAKQNDGAYVPKKVRDQVKKKQQKAVEAANSKQEREISKRVKEVAQARKIKQYDQNDVAYPVGKKAKKREKSLPTRDLHLEEMIPVRIDSKTMVYVKPGADIEAVRAKYKPQPIKVHEEKIPQRKGPKNETIDNDEVKKLVSMKVPVRQIAKMLEVRPSSVKKVVKYLGVKLI